jgi:hypothetical protein
MRQRALDGELGLAVGIDRPLPVRFIDRRRLRFAERGRRRREHEAADASLGHRAEHTDRAADVGAIVSDWVADRLPHRQPGGKVHHRRGLRRSEGRRQRGAVEDVADDERDRPRGKRFRQPFDGGRVAGREIVVDDDVIPGLGERFHAVAADVPGSPGDDDRAHGRPMDEYVNPSDRICSGV